MSDSDGELDPDAAGIAAPPIEQPQPAKAPQPAQPVQQRVLSAEEERAATPDNECIVCQRNAPAPRRCAGCRVVHYCSDDCARAHAPDHRPLCDMMRRAEAGEALSVAEMRRLQVAPDQMFAPAFADDAVPVAATGAEAPIGARYGGGGAGWRGTSRPWGGGAYGGRYGAPRGWWAGRPGYWGRYGFGRRPCWWWIERGMPCPYAAPYVAPLASAGVGIGPFSAGIVV